MSKENLEMRPLPNEHSCRLRPPDYEKYARKNCYKKHNGKCIDYIFGIVGPDESELQAMRYKTDVWNEDDARAHCKDHDGSFEPAKKESDSMEDHTERRFLPIGEMRATKNEKGEMIIEGYPIIYEKLANVCWFWEIIKKGAATEALKNSDELVLWDHQSDQPMAAKKNGTLEAKEDDKGVFIRADVSKTVWGRNGFEAILNGIIDKMSFAFLVDEDGGDYWHSELIDSVKTEIREIVRFKELYDYSPVAYPAYTETSVVARNIQIARSFREKSIPETSGEPDPKILTRTKARERGLLLEEKKFF